MLFSVRPLLGRRLQHLDRLAERRAFQIRFGQDGAGGVTDDAAVIGERDLFFIQQRDEIAHLGAHLAILTAEQTILMLVWQIFATEFIERFLRLDLAEGDEITHQFRVAA